VGESVRHDVALLPLHDPVIADRAGRIDPLLNVGRINEVRRLPGIMGPDASEEIGLQLQADRELVGIPFAQPCLL
jgi:hypothetical protein